MPRPDNARPSPAPGDGDPLVIDCDDCTMQGTDCCADCVVTFICSRQPGEAVVVDVAEERRSGSCRRPAWCPSFDTSAAPAEPGGCAGPTGHPVRVGG